jgi:hypothetical protein
VEVQHTVVGMHCMREECTFNKWWINQWGICLASMRTWVWSPTIHTKKNQTNKKQKTPENHKVSLCRISLNPRLGEAETGRSLRMLAVNMVHLSSLRPVKDLTQENQIWDWSDGSMVKSTDCSSKGPEFNSQQPRGGSQPSVMGSNALFWCVWRKLQCIHIHKTNKQTHT